MKSKLLVATFGITGCGKSTWLSKCKPVVEIDDLRKQYLGDVNDLSKEKFIFDMAKKHLMELLENCDTVFFGSTNVDSKHRASYFQSLKDEVKEKLGCQLDIKLVIFNCDKETSKERIEKDLKDGLDRADSLSLIDKQYDQYEESLKLLKREKLYKFLHYT